MSIKRKLALAAAAITVAALAAGCATQGTTSAAQPAATAQSASSCKGMSSCKGKAKCKAKKSAQAGGSCN